MAPKSAVTVSFDDFVLAVSQMAKPGRLPRGSKVPKDTLLSPHEDGVLVETPVVGTLVIADKPWTLNAPVDAKKLGAAGQSIQLSVAERQIRIKFLTTTISMPTI